jgi:hypothetical protein
MIYWEKRSGKTIGIFTTRQITWIHHRVGQLHSALKYTIGELTNEHNLFSDFTRRQEGALRLAAIVGLRTSQEQSEKDLPMFTVQFLNSMLDDAERVLATLPRTGGTVSLYDSRDSWAWVWSLYECAMNIALELDVEWDSIEAMHFNGLTREARAFNNLLDWLTDVIYSLIELADIPDFVKID